MTRKMLRFGMGAMTVLPGAALALGLGPIEVKSSLDQPLSARIPVLAAEPEQLEKLAAGLATREHFDTVGVERAPVLSQLTFELVRPEGSRPYIVVKSKAPIREPLLDMLVEVNWPGGTLLREYSLFLDPPGRSRRVTPAATAATPRASISTGRAAPAPTPTAPQPRRAGTFNGSSYGPVQPGETLWSIAEQVRPDRTVSVQQMMLALLDANPQAFWSNNVNSLNKGAILRIPTRAEIVVRSKPDAVAEASRQWKEWQANPSPYTQVAKVEEAPITPPAEVLAAEVPLHQVLLVPAEEDESPVDPEAELGSESTSGSELSGGAVDGLGVAVDAQPLVRVENGGLGLKLAGLDELSKRIPAIVAVDDSALATGAISEIVEGRIGTTIVEESTPVAPAAAAQDATKDVLAAESEPMSETATASEEEAVTVAGDLLEQAEVVAAETAVPSAEVDAGAPVDAATDQLEEQVATVAGDSVETLAETTALDETGLIDDVAEPGEVRAQEGSPLEAGGLLEESASEETADSAVDAGQSEMTGETALAPADVEPGVSSETLAPAPEAEITAPVTDAVPDTEAPVTDPVADTEAPVTDPVAEAKAPVTAAVSDDTSVATADSALDVDSETGAGNQTAGVQTADVGVSDQAPSEAVAEMESVLPPVLAQFPLLEELAATLPPEMRELLAPLKEPRNLAMAGGVAILFLILLALLIRRAFGRRHEPEQAKRSAVEATKKPASIAEADNGTHAEVRVDPMKQADVLVAVGNCTEAGRIIAEAIAANPEDDTLRLKQLEIDYAAHDANAFANHALENRERLEACELWENVSAMGAVLCPNHSLFTDGAAAQAPSDESREVVESAPPAPVEELTESTDISTPPPADAVGTEDIPEDATSPFQTASSSAPGAGHEEEENLFGKAVSDDDLDALRFTSPDERTEPTLGPGEVPATDATNVLEFEAPATPEPAVDDADEDDALAKSVDDMVVAGEEDFFTPVADHSAAEDVDLGNALEAEFEKLELEGLGDLGESSGDTQADSSEGDHESLDFGDFAHNDVTPATAESVAADESSTAGAGIESFSPDIALDATQGPGDEGSLTEAPAAGNVNESPAALDDEPGDATFVETKLDLAAAYLELGDDAGARTLYEEVLSEGNLDQKRLADEALRKLA